MTYLLPVIALAMTPLRIMSIVVHSQNIKGESQLRGGTNHKGKDPAGDAGHIYASSHALGEGVDWFNAFSEGESTYDSDADFGRAGNVNSATIQMQDGWVPDVHAPPGAGGTEMGTDPFFFHESMSGGPDAAWQTHYPGVSSGLSEHGYGVNEGPWFKRRAGSYGQGYVATDGVRPGFGGNANNPLLVHKKSGDLAADWFDNSVLQHDGFGREKFPNMLTPRRLHAAGWKERAVNTSLTCNAPGCVAAATIQMFNPYEERAQSCVFSFWVHPTDFDQTYSGEEISWITVNNVTVKTNCQPQVSGCREPVSKQLHACFLNLPS